MFHHPEKSGWRISRLLVILICVLVLMNAGPLYSHGGRGFSAWQAIQKATQLYERLITSGKLPEDWETQLVAIRVNSRKSGEQHEYVVRFQRSEGNPDSVYFFFDLKGEYAGSNFTGE